MTRRAIPQQRLFNQQIARPKFQTPQEIVHWLGALQAQDYAAAKWAVALRSTRLTDADLDAALADGSILRTHVMRPTWHFVAPPDIRWLLQLTAPRLQAAGASWYRNMELDGATFKRAQAILTKSLHGRFLTRAEIGEEFRRAGVKTGELRLTYLVMHAELEGLICSGPRRGKQFTYGLLDERVPRTRGWTRAECLAELTRRYFTSHGPATEADFAWWSGLTRSDVRAGLEMAGHELVSEEVQGERYWSAAQPVRAGQVASAAHLLPNFDEYVVGYTDRSAIFDESHTTKLDARSNPLFQYTLVLDGRIAGTWKRILKKDRVEIELLPFARLAKGAQPAIEAAAERFGKFLGSPIVLRQASRP
jgi:hypothetical protein